MVKPGKIWQYVTQRKEVGATNKTCSCNFCGHSWVSNSQSRGAQHLINCPKTPTNIKHIIVSDSEFGYISNNNTNGLKRSKTKSSISEESLAGYVSEVVDVDARSNNKTNVLQKWVDSLSKEEESDLDQKFAEMIYATGTSFNWAAHPTVLRLFNALRPGYRVSRISNKC